ncbi:MAG: glutamine--tRNA ligase/YqeY domain fusion protein [Clostridia bacterium]|jgi:glutaminyl-tRNA synthetase|nr:glutamine--tRNA ligase/YqeY domain fusion protein [Clostridia bacterium]
MADTANFIWQIVEEDKAAGSAVKTRFPPEPNGYLHIGHAKSMYVNFGTAARYGGTCNLFFDDTNPSKEKTEFVDAIRADIAWLGYRWEKEVYASDFFEIIYDYAEQLIAAGKAFVCDYSAEEIKATRGTLTEPGQESPYRSRTPEENLRLFREMRAGKYADGEKCLRAKIDMASPNINLRDPVIYRILRATHHRTGDKWCIYPMYDYAHPICDYLQGVTHSLCTLEFEDHRPLYDWVGVTLGFSPKPRQIEFARLNLTNLVMSKRYLKKLVADGSVHGWDDPRMPTLAGLRNRGIPAAAINDFCERAGVAKANSECEISYFEAVVRDYLNAHAPRAMAVVDPLKVVLTNYEGEEEIDFSINQTDENAGTRKVTFGKELYIERSDFALEPPPKYYRLKPDGYVRLKNAYIIHCDEVVTDERGEVTEVRCSYVPDSHSGADTSGIKAKGVIHWVNARTCADAVLKQYDHLLRDADYAGQDFSERMNTESEHIFQAKAEPYLVDAPEGEAFQLLRTGYYKKCTENGKLCLSEIVSLKDNFNKGGK